MSHESPEGATLLLDRDPRSPPLFPVAEDQESAAAPQSSSLDLLALEVALPPAAGGAGAPQSSSVDLLALGVDLLPPRGGAEDPQSSSFDFPALGVALPLGAALAPVAHGLLLLVAEDFPQSSSAGAVLDRERLPPPPPPPPPLGQSLDICPSSLH